MKRTSLYQDYEKDGLRMIDMENMIKALRLAWIPRLLKNGHFNYRVKDFEYLPRFYRDILLFFDELKTLMVCLSWLANLPSHIALFFPMFNGSPELISPKDLISCDPFSTFKSLKKLKRALL